MSIGPNSVTFLIAEILCSTSLMSSCADDAAFSDAGSDTDTDTDSDSDAEGCPDDMVEVPGMSACIDAYEYTNSKFAVFLAENGNDCGEADCRRMGEESQHISNLISVCEDAQLAEYVTGEDFTESGSGEFAMAEGVGDYPVGWVTWYGARDACLWEGKTMCPWDVYYAACSHGGELYFPWGGEIDGEPTDEGWEDAWESCLCNDSGYMGDTGVGAFYGCEGAYSGLFDLAGNIGEWGGTPELDGWWAYMGGSHNSNYAGDDGIGFAGAGCAFPEEWHLTDGPTPLPAQYGETAYAWEDHGFRCCLLTEE
jgi:formylglycine-generating enzyme required for sulfatase activity